MSATPAQPVRQRAVPDSPKKPELPDATVAYSEKVDPAPGPPPALPRPDEAAIVAEIEEAKEQVDARTANAIVAYGEERWDDCERWLSDAQAAVWRVKRLGVELSTLRKMRANHD